MRRLCITVESTHKLSHSTFERGRIYTKRVICHICNYIMIRTLDVHRDRYALCRREYETFLLQWCLPAEEVAEAYARGRCDSIRAESALP